MITKSESDLKNLLEKINADYPSLTFKKSDHFRWSPEDRTIFYYPKSSTAAWSLLHETGHMICGHAAFKSDIGLLRMEVAAWHEARKLAELYGLSIDEEYIEKCLDSYREWIYRRSSCPVCTQAGIEKKTGLYVCINCRNQWRVTNARFCRVYRKTVTD